MAYKTERLKRIDKWATPTAAFLGRVISAATGWRARCDERPVVIRPGGMGDLIAAQIAVEELGRDPRADVRWVVERRSAAWARLQRLDHLTYDGGAVRALAAIAGRHRAVVNTEQLFGLSQGLANAVRAHGGRVLVPETNRGSRFGTAVPYDPLDEHETVAFRRMLRAAWRLEPDDGLPRPRRRMVPSDGTLIVAISGRQSTTRSLDVGAWAEIASAWAAGRELLVVAAPVDHPFADDLAAALGEQARRLELGFDDLAGRIASAEGLLTMDGGPVHIAGYYGTPTRAIFTSGREVKWAPLSEGSEILRTRDLWCQPCTLFGQTPPCVNALACHRLDPVGDVRPSPALG